MPCQEKAGVLHELVETLQTDLHLVAQPVGFGDRTGAPSSLTNTKKSMHPRER